MAEKIYVVIDDGEVKAAFDDFSKANEYIDMIDDHGKNHGWGTSPWLGEGPEVEEVMVYKKVLKAFQDFQTEWEEEV